MGRSKEREREKMYTYVYVYIYIHTHTCLRIYVYMYFIYRDRERHMYMQKRMYDVSMCTICMCNTWPNRWLLVELMASTSGPPLSACALRRSPATYLGLQMKTSFVVFSMGLSITGCWGLACYSTARPNTPKRRHQHNADGLSMRSRRWQLPLRFCIRLWCRDPNTNPHP